MIRSLVVGVFCFLVGAAGFALAQSTLNLWNFPSDTTPVTSDVIYVWTGGAGCTAGGNCTKKLSIATLLATPWTWTGAQRAEVTPLTVTSGSVAAPNFDGSNDFSFTLSGCPCTLPNPSTTLVAGQTGVFEITQGGAGTQTIGTYGTNYLASTEPTLSTSVGAIDQVPYRVTSAGKIAFFAPLLNAH